MFEYKLRQQFQKIRKKGRRQKASLTVEASFLIPMAVMAAGIVLSLCFYLYEYCWYTQAACEAVLAGSTQGVLKGQSVCEKAKERWDVLEDECYLKPQKLAASVSGTAETAQVQISGTVPLWGRDGLYLELRTSQKAVKPVTFIRIVAAVKQGAG